MSRIAVLVALLLALLVPAPVRAAFHIAVIDEVMSGVNNGTISNSNIQYVEIRQLFAGQDNVCHTRLTVFRSQDGPVRRGAHQLRLHLRFVRMPVSEPRPTSSSRAWRARVART